jgi:putative peptide zinc metalloprotease protein
MYASIAVLATLIAGVLLIPLPHSIICTLEVQPEDAATVYVDVAGTLDEIDVDPGQHVSENTRLAKLTNHDVELELLKLSGSRDQMLREIESLQRQRYHDDQAGAQIPATREALAAVEDQRREKQADLQRLELLAPAEGVVFPPPRKPSQEDPNGQLPGWSGTPLDEQNLGAYLEAGSLFCQIGDPKQMEAILVIDQGDLEFVATGQKVEIKLDELPHETLHGAITEIANVELEVSPTRLSVKSGGELPTKTDASGVERPMSTSYQARVPLENAEGLLRPGLRGRAKVHTGWQTLGARFWRLVTQTINFRL